MAELWLDAEDAVEKGGWKADTQFVHLMGGSCLLAADEPGIPVADACFAAEVPEAGRYRAWVRDRNWMRQYSPGTFQLVVNGENNGRVLGAMPSDAWIWEIAGDYDLKEGSVKIALHDMTGYFGRCAGILLTTDMDYVPPREVDRLLKERARIRGYRQDTVFGGDYDVIVAGGGPGGVPAAIASARLGARTLLLQDRSMLGGNGSREIGITFDGAAVNFRNARETGIAEEIRRLRDSDPEYYGDWTRALEKLAAKEKNLTVRYDERVWDAFTENGRIKNVTVRHMRTLEKTSYAAKIFIDCTGDGWLGYYAGAKYRYGREAARQHGESLAPALADTLTMSGCIKSGNLPFFYDAGREVEYHAPKWVPELPRTDEAFGRAIAKGTAMQWWLEVPNTYDGMMDAEETRDALLLVILGYYDHVKNYWSGKETMKNCGFRFSGIINGRRESRRLIGDYVLTQDDCLSGRAFEDAVAYTGWHIDVHHPGGIYSGAEGTMDCAKHVPMPVVPYRCLYSKNIENLLFAGRNISVTHLALGTVRVENTIATLGQAAGTAAAMCVKLSETPRGIYERHIHKLRQTLLENDQYIPGAKNEDPTDPCLTAKAEASSTDSEEIFETFPGKIGPLVSLGTVRITRNPVIVREGCIRELWLKLFSEQKDTVKVTIHAQNAGRLAFDYYGAEETYDSEAAVEPGKEHWVRFPVEIPVEANERFDRMFLRVWTDRADGVFWRLYENQSFYYSSGEACGAGDWKMRPNTAFALSVNEPREEKADCSPENVINGISRIVDKDRYEWVSDRKGSFPQWLSLTFERPAEVDHVSVVFDTDLSSPGTCWTSKIPGVPECVKDYVIEGYADGKWAVLAEEKGNFLRKRTHGFQKRTLEKIRITVTATWGDRSARIMEIRAGKHSSDKSY